MDLALNNLQWLMCDKAKLNQSCCDSQEKENFDFKPAVRSIFSFYLESQSARTRSIGLRHTC